MKKRIFIIVVCMFMLTISLMSFSACGFLERDERRDMRQVVATVMPGTEHAQNIYKFELRSAVLSQFQGQLAPNRDAVLGVLDNLVNNRLMEIELINMFSNQDLMWLGKMVEPEINPCGDDCHVCTPLCVIYKECPDTGAIIDIECAEICDKEHAVKDFRHDNAVMRQIYDSIDDELRAIQRNILLQDGTIFNEESPAPQPPSPDLPIREPEDPDIQPMPEPEPWVPEEWRIPAQFGGANQISLERAALIEFTQFVLGQVEDGFRDYDREELAYYRSRFNSYIRDNRLRDLYLALGASYPIEFLIGNESRYNIKLQILQEHLFDGIEISIGEVEGRFNDARNAQEVQFRRDPGAYAAAVRANERILFRPTADFFFVRHVLLSFTDSQTARLAQFRQRPNITAAEIANFRDNQLVNEMSIFPRNEQGFHDFSRSFTPHEIQEMIYSEVNSQNSLVAANRRFEDFIFMFNQDPGAFQNMIGYAMPRHRGADSGFMPEFAERAWDLAEGRGMPGGQSRVGSVHPSFAVTDFGIHIMFYSYDPPSNWRAFLWSREDQNERRTFREAFEADIRTEQEGRVMQDWQRTATQSARNQEDSIRIFDRALRGLTR